MTSTRCDAAVLRALSADAVLLDQLRTPGADGRVDTVFRHVINVLTSDGQLIALASRSSGDAPRTLVVDVEDWSGSAVEAGQVVRFAAGVILLPAPAGDFRIDIRAARRWNPIPVSLGHLGDDHLAVATRALGHLLRSHGVPGGMLAAHRTPRRWTRPSAGHSSPDGTRSCTRCGSRTTRAHAAPYSASWDWGRA